MSSWRFISYCLESQRADASRDRMMASKLSARSKRLTAQLASAKRLQVKAERERDEAAERVRLLEAACLYLLKERFR